MSDIDKFIERWKKSGAAERSAFQISPAVRRTYLHKYPELASRLPAYFAGSDLTRTRDDRYVIDFFDLTEKEAAQFGAPINVYSKT